MLVQVRDNKALNWSSGNGNEEEKTKVSCMIHPFNNPVQREQGPVVFAS